MVSETSTCADQCIKRIISVIAMHTKFYTRKASYNGWVDKHYLPSLDRRRDIIADGIHRAGSGCPIGRGQANDPKGTNTNVIETSRTLVLIT